MKLVLLLSLLTFIFPGTGYSQQEDLHDHKAKIIRVTGRARILKHSTGAWQSAVKGLTVENGDQIVTQKKGVVELAYDNGLLNVGRIGQNTQAEFVSIEPTEIHLSDGSFLNLLDGLESGQKYQITTPTAVAAVRGTYFDVLYNPQNKRMDVGVFEDRNSGLGNVEITPLGAGGKSFGIGEGNQASFEPQDLETGQVNTEAVSSDRAEEAGQAAKGITEMREESAGSGGGTQQNSDGSEDVTQNMTQGEFALWLIEEAGGLRLLPTAANGQDAINFLIGIGIIPEGGWHADELVTDDFLRSFFGAEGEGLSREQIIDRLQELIQSEFNQQQANAGVFPVSGASGSSPA